VSLYTRRHVADACGVTPAAIAHYERGGGVPRIEVARALVRLHGGAEAAACAITIGEELQP
jgi:transcriptional regulator with XRE-family HTH domain